MVEVIKGNWMCLQEIYFAVISLSDRVTEEKKKALSDGKSKAKNRIRAQSLEFRFNCSSMTSLLEKLIEAKKITTKGKSRI